MWAKTPTLCGLCSLLVFFKVQFLFLFIHHFIMLTPVPCVLPFVGNAKLSVVQFELRYLLLLVPIVHVWVLSLSFLLLVVMSCVFWVFIFSTLNVVWFLALRGSVSSLICLCVVMFGNWGRDSTLKADSGGGVGWGGVGWRGVEREWIFVLKVAEYCMVI